MYVYVFVHIGASVCVSIQLLCVVWMCVYVGVLILAEEGYTFTFPSLSGDGQILFTNPSARAGYDTRSIFKRSLTGLNSEFSFS